MKDTPLLMCGEMVRATLEGRKTQTRRIITFRECGKTYHFDNSFPLTCWAWVESTGILHHGHSEIRCPYGVPGDRLWVRETFAELNGVGVKYRATSAHPLRPSESWDIGWTPSIFMPRWASRITLEVVSVRVQRVQDISEEDARAEGVQAVIGKKIHGWAPHVIEFSLLWDSINAKRDGGNYAWSANPHVWAITFKRV